MKRDPLRGLTLTLRKHASATGGEGLVEAAPSRVEDVPSPWVLLPSWASFLGPGEPGALGCRRGLGGRGSCNNSALSDIQCYTIP